MPTWIRVRDTSTGHEFDVEKSALRPGLERVNKPDYPDLEGPGALPRPAKPFVGKDGQPATPASVEEAAEQPAAETADTKPARTRTGRGAGATEGVEQ